MISVKKIAHAVYEMPDVDKQTEYYTEILGLTVRPVLASAAVDMRLDLVNPHLRSTPC